MNIRAYKNPKKIFRIRLAFAAAALVFLIITGIIAVNAAREPVMALLGFDTTDYEHEKVIEALDSDCEDAEKISDIIKMMLCSGDQKLTSFSGAREAASLYSDSILCRMLNDNYLKYVGNTEMLSKMGNSNYNYSFSPMIPTADFEATVYKYFGGDKMILNKSGKLFTYLEEAGTYYAPVVPACFDADVRIFSFERTENTLRLTFTLNNDVDKYLAVAIKREDGTIFIKSLKAY